MRWRQVLKNLVRTAGELGQELKNAFRELIKTFPSIDKDRMPDPKQVIRELKRTVRTIITVGKEKLGELRETIQNLKEASD
ncbi:MAG: hypothetical protein OXI67_07055 [Candidatus Poribacteria bacterium]|nr:hypothetical protein [Candidatus Poribacteria bacterium]